MIWRFIEFLSKFLFFLGRKSAEAEQAQKAADTALQAKEIENEVEALSTDALKRRSRVWVRGVNDR